MPDVDKFEYDFDRNTVVREKVRMVINPDDASAVAFALKAKAAHLDTKVEVVTMAPKSVMPLLRDLVRVGVDQVTLLSDALFSGSDSYATSKILATFIKECDYDFILTGTHAIDGDTSHVPAQIADILTLTQMSNIVYVDESSLNQSNVIFKVENESAVSTYQLNLPAILSLQKESGYKLPYITYEAMSRDVDNQIRCLTNEHFNFSEEEVGIGGSLTKVNRTFIKEYKKRDKIVVQANEDGIDQVYTFMKEKGYIL